MFNDYCIRGRKSLRHPTSLTLQQGRMFTAYLGATGCSLHQIAYVKGYQTRKECTIYNYAGRYGIGFAVIWPNSNSSNYSIIEYYTFKD